MAGIELPVRATFADGQVKEYTAKSCDVINWERTTRGASWAQLRDGGRLVDCYKIAHLAAVRLGLYSGPLAQFETDVDLEFPGDEEDQEEVDPTRPAP